MEGRKRLFFAAEQIDKESHAAMDCIGKAV
jgi:hypothetical protein